jgi:uncharacterized membrane protein YvlD (DUF360 family)
MFQKINSVPKQEDKLRDKPGYEHLNDPLHVLVEAEFPANIIDARLNQAVTILQDLLKPVVCTLTFSVFIHALNIFCASLTAVILRMSPWTTTRSNN